MPASAMWTLESVLVWTSAAFITAQDYFGPNGASTAKCRCLPGDSCWPSVDQWNTLNTTIGGRLLIPHPTGYQCYGGPGYNSHDCQQIQKYYNRPGFLLNKPGSMQAFNWEDLGEQRCALEASNDWDAVCQAGRTPAYGVEAHTVDDIQKALAFASQHNLRIVVKTTGHDYFGRSTAPGALMLWLRNFQGGLETKTGFTPNGCDASGQLTEPVITVTGGKTWDDVYAKVDQDFNGKYCIVAGFCFDIAAAGGYTLGGGHSVLSPSFGLAVDNVLEMTMVTASGKLVTANACQNKDLFWALCGGGGGTFGVLTSVTYKLHSVPSGFNAYSVQVVDQNKTGNLNPIQVESIIEVLARRTADLDNIGWGGYMLFNPAYGFVVMLLVPADKANALDQAKALKNELVGMQAASGFLVMPFANLGTFSQHYDHFDDWRSWTDTIGVFDGFYSGVRIALGTRLIPAAALTHSRSAAQTLMAGVQKNGFAAGFVATMVAGSGVRSRDPQALETSVTPAWRKAAWHCYLFTGWDATTSNADIAARTDVLNSGVQVWREGFPDSGVYFNEGFTEEPNWQQAFWGSNYERLLGIKKTVDPNGMFVCSTCVGSELWDKSGNCRV
ncbi:uncharacterized protein LOC129591079 [Paramacrobiotus metropolitanus]|uniref:uncharacterized protein LOC129591079 n=1 Tax=Paramacrobiotus metropolitanus TaxID=2943436 RepID=UPI002445C7D9|nr:uncharacterized protein LOC129591079 [Paramacrobiotus metropolitanus]